MRNPYVPIPMKVEANNVETSDGGIRTLAVSFDDEKDSFRFVPGQFAELSLLGIGEAPFGIASSPLDAGRLEFTISRVGRVTTELHYLDPGEPVGLRGPMGNGYPIGQLRGHDVLVVGGGFGFSTLRSFIRFALDPSNRGDFGRITVVYGARNPGLLLYRQDLEDWGRRDDLELVVTVDRDDGSWSGRTGTVPAALEGVAIDPGSTAAIVCGPPAMIRYSLPVLAASGLGPDRIHLSLEMKMKCGIGKCGRCNIGSSYVCIDGPVYSLEILETLQAGGAE